MAEFGECAMCLRAVSAGKNKLDVRWMDGAWLGVKLESWESIVGAADGVVRARDFGNRRREDDGATTGLTNSMVSRGM